MHGFAVVGMVVAAMVVVAGFVVAALLGHEDPVLHLFRVEFLAYTICVYSIIVELLFENSKIGPN